MVVSMGILDFLFIFKLVTIKDQNLYQNVF